MFSLFRKKEPPIVLHNDIIDEFRKALKFSHDEAGNFNQRCRNEWVAERIKTISPGSRVLDLGAGTGRYRDLFAHCIYQTHDFCEFEGLKGREGTYTKIDFVSDATDIPVEDASFDAVLCTEVLEHVPYPIKVVAEISRILKPNGRVFLTAPLGCGLHQEPYIFYGGYTPYWYNKFLPENRINVISIQPNKGTFAHLGQECARFAGTFDMHGHLHGDHGEVLRDFVGNILCRYLYELDGKIDHTQFTVGYFVEGQKEAN